MDYGRTQTFCLTYFTRLKGIIPIYFGSLTKGLHKLGNRPKRINLRNKLKC